MPRVREFVAVLLVCNLALLGCRNAREMTFDACATDYQPFLQQVEYADAQIESDVWTNEASAIPPPSVRRADELEDWPMTLDEAVRVALSQNEVIRQAGGRIVNSPDSTTTVHDPAIQETDPRFGIEGALAAFDAEFFTNLYFQHREREFNNRFLGSGEFALEEDLSDFAMGFRKTTAAGTRFTFDNITDYDYSNSPRNRVPSVYNTMFTASVRHPLLQGGGIAFNRIAGPSATPGVYRGVLIARINSDIALVDFETSVRNLLRDVERTYWELYYGYRDLDTKMQGREYALEAWELEKARVTRGTRAPDQEAYAREQFYAAQAAVENALSGRGGTLGVLGAERELRSLLGLPATDGRLIRPSTPPLRTDIRFDWEESLGYALVRRGELRRQRWTVKQRELELTAARNFHRIRLDLVGRYRWRGFGDELMGGSDNAFSDLFDGNKQGWLFGFEMRTPVGNRIGHVAVRNAELQLRREHVILDEQERQVSLELREAFTELDRAYAVSRSNYNRHVAAQFQLDAERKRNAEGDARLDMVLDAQRRAVLAEIAFHRSIVDYNLAVSQIQLARGTILDSLQVYLSEGPWPVDAHASAAREARRYRPTRLRGACIVPPPVSAGVYPQRMDDYSDDDPEPLPEGALDDVD